MQASDKEIESLFDIQKLDLELISIKKRRSELPQRIEVVKVRKKRDEIAPKLDQILSLEKSKQNEINAMQREDDVLKEKQQNAQSAIDSASSDYRFVESHTKDMAGIIKRRTTLKETLDTLRAEYDKIVALKDQIEAGIKACDEQEEQLRDSFKAEDESLFNHARDLIKQRSELASTINPEIVDAYEKVAEKTGGVALTTLDESNNCGACRTTIDEGKLIELNTQAPLSFCPYCSRIIFIKK